MKVAFNLFALLAVSQQDAVWSFKPLHNTAAAASTNSRQHAARTSSRTSLKLAADKDNTMNSYENARRRMKFMQPDPHMGGLGSSGKSDDTTRRPSPSTTMTSEDPDVQIHVHHHATEDATMAAYMDAMDDAQSASESDRVRNGGEIGRNPKNMPVQDVEVVDDVGNRPTGLSVEDQVDFAAQSFFDEKEALEQEAAKSFKLEQEAASSLKLEREAAAKSLKLEQEAASTLKLEREAAAKSLKLEQEAASTLKLEREAAAKSLKLEQEAASTLKLEREAAISLELEREAANTLKLEQEAAKTLELEQDAAKSLELEQKAAALELEEFTSSDDLALKPLPSTATSEWTGTSSSKSVFKRHMDHAMKEYSNPILMGGDILIEKDTASREVLMTIAMKKFKAGGPIEAELYNAPPKAQKVEGGIPTDAEVPVVEESITPENMFPLINPSATKTSVEWTGPESSKSAFKEQMDTAMHEYSNPVLVQVGGDFLKAAGTASRDKLMRIAMHKFNDGGPVDADLAKTLPQAQAVKGGIPKGAEFTVAEESTTLENIFEATSSTSTSSPEWTGTSSSESSFKEQMNRAMHEYTSPVQMGGDILIEKETASREDLMEIAMKKFNDVGAADADLHKKLPKAQPVEGGIPSDAEVSVAEESITPENVFPVINYFVATASPEWTGASSSESSFKEQMDLFLNQVMVRVGGQILTGQDSSSSESLLSRAELMKNAMKEFEVGGPIDAKLYQTLPKATAVQGGILSDAEVPVAEENADIEQVFQAFERPARKSIRAWIGYMSSKSAFKEQMDIAMKSHLNPVMVRIGGELLTGKDVEPLEHFLSREELMKHAQWKFKAGGPIDAELHKTLPMATAVQGGIPSDAEVPVAEESITPESLFNGKSFALEL